MSPTSSKICNLATCATEALDTSVCEVVAAAALEQYAKINELIKQYTHIDVNEFFGYVALLAVLCWFSQWLKEIVHFVTHTIPKFIHNLTCGKFSLCLLDCDESEPEAEANGDDEY
jgi:isopentenyldiphosphate isomerase